MDRFGCLGAGGAISAIRGGAHLDPLAVSAEQRLAFLNRTLLGGVAIPPLEVEIGRTELA
jgi:hypothetical protein